MLDTTHDSFGMLTLVGSKGLENAINVVPMLGRKLRATRTDFVNDRFCALCHCKCSERNSGVRILGVDILARKLMAAKWSTLFGFAR